MIDILLRAETPGTLKTAVTSQRFRDVVGDMTDPETGEIVMRENGTGETRDGGNWKYFPPDTVVVVPAVLDGDGTVITPAVTDPWVWLHLRLDRLAAQRDEEAGTGDDRWNKSRLIRWVKENGMLGNLGQMSPWDQVPAASNVQGALFDLPGGGPANGRIGVLRTADMDAQGLLWHRYAGALAA